MRTLTTQQTQAVAADYAVHARVYIDKDGTGNMTDISSVEGRDWLESVSIKDSVDQNGLEASIVLRREERQVSLSTLMENSPLNQAPYGTYTPFINIARAVRIEAAIVPIDVAPVTADWINVFQGAIDDIDFGDDNPTITLSCRDLSGELVDTWIESFTNYSNASGTLVETIMQQILDDWGDGQVLYVPVSPGWAILPYQQTKEPIMDALRKLAQQIGWDVKYRWDSGSSAWRLTLYAPDRANTTPDFTFSASQVTSVKQLRISRQNIRNKIVIVYTDANTGDRATITSSDMASMTKYGVRYMEVAEDATSQIDSSSEATTLGDAILSDLMEPEAEVSVDVPAFIFTETGDLYRFSANGRHFDTDQDLAVVSWDLKFDRDDCTSTFTVRGAPSGGFMRWLRIEGRAGVAPVTDVDGPSQPSNMSVRANMGAIEVSHDMLTDPDWSYSECHLSLESDFIPTLATKAADGRTNIFKLSGLVPGLTYYAKVFAVDSRGNRSPISSQVVVASEYVGPGHQSLDTQAATIIPNGDFGVWSAPNTPDTTPPDNWVTFKSADLITRTEDSSLWKRTAGGIWYDSDITAQGGYSIKINKINVAQGAPDVFYGVQLRDMFPSAPEQLYEFSTTIYKTGKLIPFAFIFYFYRADKITPALTYAFIAATGIEPDHTWYKVSTVFKTSNTAAYCLPFIVVDASSGETGDFYVDKVEMRRVLPSFSAYNSSQSASIASGVDAPISLNAETYDYGNNFVAGAAASAPYFLCPEDGVYQFSGASSLIGLANNKQMYALITVNGIVVKAGDMISGSGFAYTRASVAVAAITLVKNDVVKLLVHHNDNSSLTEANSSNGEAAWFTGACVNHG